MNSVVSQYYCSILHIMHTSLLGSHNTTETVILSKIGSKKEIYIYTFEYNYLILM